MRLPSRKAGAILMRSSIEGVQTNMQDGSQYLILACCALCFSESGYGMNTFMRMRSFFFSITYLLNSLGVRDKLTVN